MAQQPLNPAIGTATFFICGERNDDVAIRLECLLLILNEIGDPDGGLGFIVCSAATAIKAVLFDKLKRIPGQGSINATAGSMVVLLIVPREPGREPPDNEFEDVPWRVATRFMMIST